MGTPFPTMAPPGPMPPNPMGVPLTQPPQPQYGNMKKLPSEKRKELAEDLNQKIKDGASKWSTKMQEIAEADKFWMGEHWDDNSPPWMPKPVENWVFAAVEQHSANLSTANVVPIISAQGPGDDEVAEKFSHLVKYLWQPNKLNMRRVIRRAIHTAMKAGTAIVKVYWNPNENGGRMLPQAQTFKNGLTGDDMMVSHTLYKGEICVENVDPTKIIPDPNGYAMKGVGECSWIAVRTNRTKDWILNNPMFIEYLGKAELKRIVDDLPDHHTNANSNMYHDRTINQTKNPFVDEVWLRKMDEHGNYSVNMAYVVGAETLYYAENLYQDGEFPFAVLYDYEVDESFFGIGEPKQIIPNQKTINQVNRLVALNAMHMTNTQKVVTQDSGIDPNEVAEFGTMPGAVWRSRTVDGIKPLDVNEIPVSVFKVAESAREGIRNTMAMDESNMGQFGGSVTAASGIKMIQDKANVRDQDKGMNVEDFVSRVTSLVISRAQQFYTTERYIPILDNPATPSVATKYFPMTGSDYADISLSVVVQAGSGTPINKASIAQKAMDLFNLQATNKFDPPLITAEELIKSIDGFPMADDILRRIRDAATGKQAMEAIEIAKVMLMLMQQGIDPMQLPPDQLIALTEQIKAQTAAQPGPEQPAAGPPAPPPQGP